MGEGDFLLLLLLILARQTDPGLKSGICVWANFHFKKKKKQEKSTGREWMVEHSPQILASEEKATTPFSAGQVAVDRSQGAGMLIDKR